MAVKINKGTTFFQLPVTPMVDLVFNLLLFFIVATKFAEEERALDISLPQASEAQPITVKPREMFINIDQDGGYFVTGKSISLPELEQVLQMVWVNNPGRASVVVRADQRCPWKFVVAAMNACTKAKIRDYRVTTREGPENSNERPAASH
jgi:biopolymer transport protein ExbD